METKPALLARLTRALATQEGGSPLPLRLCLAFIEVTATEGGAITMGFAPSERFTLSATNHRAERVEDLQDVLREGPSLDAFRTGLPAGGLEPAEQFRCWPMLCESIAGLGGGPVVLHAYPLRPDTTVLGVLSVFHPQDERMALTEDEAQFLADAVGMAILGEIDPAAAEQGYGDIEAWVDQDRVAAATGMVVAQLRIAPVDALAVLRAHAFAHDTTLLQVSTLVLDKQLDFRD